MNPGIYPGLSWDDYKAIDAISQSLLKEALPPLGSMKRMKWRMENPKQPTDAMVLGSCLHLAFLEPEAMVDRIAVWQGKVRRGKEWDQFQTENAGKYMLTQNQFAKFQGMVREIRRNRTVRELMATVTDYEVSAVRDVAGVRCKSRCDALNPDAVIDLKKVYNRVQEPRRWYWTCIDMGYHIQAALYTMAFDRREFIHVTVEEDPPHDVVVFEVDQSMIEEGTDQLIALLDAVKRCREADEWPGREDGRLVVSRPEGGLDVMLQIDGESVAL